MQLVVVDEHIGMYIVLITYVSIPVYYCRFNLLVLSVLINISTFNIIYEEVLGSLGVDGGSLVT